MMANVAAALQEIGYEIEVFFCVFYLVPKAHKNVGNASCYEVKLGCGCRG